MTSLLRNAQNGKARAEAPAPPGQRAKRPSGKPASPFLIESLPSTPLHQCNDKFAAYTNPCTKPAVSNCWLRQFLRMFRPLVLKIVDLEQREVMEVRRPLRCSGCLGPWCLQTVEVMAPPGTTAGYVIEEWSVRPKFRVEDANHKTVLRIDGPCCPCQCVCNAVVFRILSTDGVTEVGRISKTWSGLTKEIFTDADNYGISFPRGLDITMKAVLIGAAFLIDFMFFES
ncbi:phospholipid scramblase 1-like [Haemaphysalis longicornis]